MAIELKREDKDAVLPSIKKFMLEEFETEIGDLRAGFILDYFLAEIGPFVYNKAIGDAEAFFAEKTADLPVSCYEEEQTYWQNR